MLKKLLFISLLTLFSTAFFAQTPDKQITKGVINGAAVSLPKPDYPTAAGALKASGEVVIQVTIDEQGNVISAKAISGHPLLRQAAEQAAWQAKFKPTTLEGRPVKVTGTIIYNFVPPKENLLNAQPDEIWAIGFLFAMLEKTDEEIFKEFGEDFDFSKDFAGFAKDIPEEIAAEKPLLEKFAQSTGAERQRLAGEISRSLEKYFKSNELEVYQTGLLLGSVIGESFRSFLPLIKGETDKLDSARIKTQLMLLRDKLNSSKAYLSPQTAANFGELAAFADTDLNSLENLKKFIATVSKILETISQDDENEKDMPPANSRTSGKEG